MTKRFGFFIAKLKMINPRSNKLYIAVLDEVPDHMVPVLVAHSVLGAHLKFFVVSENYSDWLVNSFRKCVLKVNEKEFKKMTALDHVYVGHENKTLDGMPSCVVIAPREDYPNVVKFAKMWVPNQKD